MKTMTSKERLLKAMRGEMPDMVPVAPLMWHLLRKWHGSCFWPLEVEAGRKYDFDPIPHMTWLDGPPFHNNIRVLNGSYLHEGRAYCEDLIPGVTVDIHIERRYENTLVRRTIKTPAGELSDAIEQPKPAANFGEGGFNTSGWVGPRHVERLIKGKEDLEKIQFILSQPKPEELVRIRAIRDCIGQNGFMEIDCLSPVDYLANQAMDIKELQRLYREDRAFFDNIIELFWNFTFKRTKAYLDAGAEGIRGIWYSCGESDGWTPESYREVFFPLLKKHVELVHTYNAVYDYNEEGKVMKLLPFLKEAGIDVLKTITPPPEGDADLRRIKEEIGSTICLHGYIDSIRILEQGTPETIEAEVKRTIETAAPGGGFIIGSSRPITVNTPHENIISYFNACRKYGNYRHLD